MRRTRWPRFLRLLRLLRLLLLFGPACFRRPGAPAATAAATTLAASAGKFRGEHILRKRLLTLGARKTFARVTLGARLSFRPRSLVLFLRLLLPVLRALLFLLLAALALPLLLRLLSAAAAFFALAAATLVFTDATGPLLELADLLLHVAAGEIDVLRAEEVMPAIRATLPPLGVSLLAAGAEDGFRKRHQ